MARGCSICQHRARGAMEEALNHGSSLRQVASRFGVNFKALDRHRSNGHMAPAQVPVLHGDVEIVRDVPVHADPMQQLRALRAASLESLNLNRRRGDEQFALAWAKQTQTILALEIESATERKAYEETGEGMRAKLAADEAKRRKMMDLAAIMHDKLLERVQAHPKAKTEAPILELVADNTDAPPANPAASPVRSRSR